jgi:hypothetical protein
MTEKRQYSKAEKAAWGAEQDRRAVLPRTGILRISTFFQRHVIPGGLQQEARATGAHEA